jgi:tRNA G18 (ribose-2'-O)-methylase SpoU
MRHDASVHRVSVSDPADARVSDFTSLTDVQLRRRREPDEGLFLAEGDKVIRRALAAGYSLRAVLLCEERWLEPLADVLPDDAHAYVAAPAVMAAVTGYAVHRGALASFARRPLPEPGELLHGARRVAVLEDVNDHTNLGAIFRSAAALGLDAVLLTPRCADPLYRRAVKVSMGAVLAVPYARLPWWQSGFELLRGAGSARSRSLPSLARCRSPTSLPTPWSGRPCCSGPRGPGSPVLRSPVRTCGYASRCPRAWTRSTSARRVRRVLRARPRERDEQLPLGDDGGREVL